MEINDLFKMYLYGVKVKYMKMLLLSSGKS
jgi:hypothetical protein